MSDGLIIEVENLTKRYAGQAAVDRITFTVQRGEIVGFLGPNGAGKSTTMRILACYLPATYGTARVAGFDVFTQADEVRRRIGYMPENNPLHLDMRVREYLKFRARLKGLGIRQSRERVEVEGGEYFGRHFEEAEGTPGSSVDAPRTFWLTRSSLLNAVHRAGFGSVCQAAPRPAPGSLRAPAHQRPGAPSHRAHLDAHPFRGGNDLQSRAHHARRENSRGGHNAEPAEHYE